MSDESADSMQTWNNIFVNTDMTVLTALLTAECINNSYILYPLRAADCW